MDNTLFFTNSSEYILTIITINIFIYIVMLYSVCSIFFLFDLKYVKTLTDLKGMNFVDSISLFVIISLLSLAGIPPLVGFCSKFLLFMYFLKKTNIAILCFFIIFNFFAMFFYLQNTRYLVSKEPKAYFNIKNNYAFWDSNLILLAVVFGCINVWGILCFDDAMIHVMNVYTYIL